MGVVYLAHNTMMGRDEVLKVMGRHIMERPGVLERFQREIRAVAKLRHPNIVAAYSAFRIEGGLVFAMEYVEGLDLSRLVKAKGPLPVAHAAYFIHQAALGLQHAHEKGMIHRDIKPHNLMLTHDGKARLVKVLDFGLAKATREQKIDGGLTSEGQALGTPDYIAPEQIVNALDVDIRADIYSLGGTLFYLLTGRPPFQATSLYDIYQAHMSRDAEPLNLIRLEVPAELAALVAKMMAKDPKRRFQTPAEVAQALTPFFKSKSGKIQAETSQAGPVKPKPLRIIDQPLPTELPDKAVTPTSLPQPKAVSTESRWESMIDFAEMGLVPTGEEPRLALRSGTPRWVWPTLTAATLLFASFLALFVLDFRVKTPDGTIVLQGLPGDADLLVDGVKVKLTWPGDDKPVEIRAVPGEHKVEVSKGGFQTFGQRVRFQSGGSETVIVRLEPLVPERAAATVPASKVVASPSPPASRFMSLFNGKDLKGWKDFLPNGSKWEVVEGGIIEGRGNDQKNMAVLLSQRQDFTNFRFRAQFRHTRGKFGWIELRRASRETNGSFYRVATGIFKVEHGSTGSVGPATDYIYGTQFFYESKSEIPSPEENIWYTLEIAAIGNRITTSVNGTKVVEYVDEQARYRRGAIALGAGAGTTIQFREVMIEILADDDRAAAKWPEVDNSITVREKGPGTLDSTATRKHTGPLARVHTEKEMGTETSPDPRSNESAVEADRDKAAGGGSQPEKQPEVRKDPSHEGIFKSLGLVKPDGEWWVMASEAEVLKTYERDVWPALVALREAFEELAESLQVGSDFKARARVLKEYREKWAKFYKATEALEPLVGKVEKQYGDLGNDPDFVRACDEIRAQTKVYPEFYPSQKFAIMKKKVIEARRAYSPKVNGIPPND